MKKLFEWIWNITVALVVAACILAIVGSSMATAARLTVIQDQIEELYGIQLYGNQMEMQILVAMIKEIKAVREEILENKVNIPKRLEETEKKITRRILTIQKEMEKEDQLPFAYIKKVTVRVVGKKEANSTMGWLGTGVVVKITEDFTYVLTNAHVAKKGTIIAIKHNEKIYPSTILKNSAFNDLALIRINGKLSGKEVVRGFAEPQIQEKIYSVGMYLTNYFIYGEGTVAGTSKDKKLIVNLPSAPGCSGSGIFNSKGKVVGLLYGGYVVRYFTSDTSRALCVPVSAIKVFLAEYLN